MARPLTALALVLAVVAGCGDGSDSSAARTRTPVPTLPPDTPSIVFPTPGDTPIQFCSIINGTGCTPTRIPIEIPTATTPIVLCYEISGSPCPTASPTPSPTATPADGIFLEEVCELFGPLTPTVCRSPAVFPTPR